MHRNFKEKDGFTCYDMTTADYRGILFNFANDYWTKNRDIIPAVCYSIDRQAIIDSVLLGEGMPAYSPLQRNIYNNENVEHYDYNPEKAQEILEAAGCTRNSDGFYERDGEEIGFVISVMSGEQDRIDIAQAAAQQLRETGINCTVEIPAQMDWGGQMACLIGWGSPFDADDHTYKVFGTDKGANYSSYSNEKVDEYLSLARQSDDPEVRKEYYGKFQEELAEDPAYAFICYIDANYVADSGIQGISKDTVLGHHGVGIFLEYSGLDNRRIKTKKADEGGMVTSFLSVQEKNGMKERLKVEHLSVSFFTDEGEVQAVRDVSFSLNAGEVLAVVGESGCGKSVLCKSIMKLLPENAKIKNGKILVNGEEIAGYGERRMRELRGKLFSMVFQNPMTSLNPTMTVGAQIAEAVRAHQKDMGKEEVEQRVTELMQLVGIEQAEERKKAYPYHFSGGMRQRIVLAIALAGNPEILFADEPTTALDVTIQAQILDLLREIQKNWERRRSLSHMTLAL